MHLALCMHYRVNHLFCFLIMVKEHNNKKERSNILNHMTRLNTKTKRVIFCPSPLWCGGTKISPYAHVNKHGLGVEHAQYVGSQLEKIWRMS